MAKIVSGEALQNAILQLEAQQANEARLLKTQFHSAYESIKPINLLKSTFEQAAASQALKGNVVNTGIGLAVGYLSRLLLRGATGGPVKSILGLALQFGVANVVAKNPGFIKSLGAAFFRLVKRKPTDTPPLNHQNL